MSDPLGHMPRRSLFAPVKPTVADVKPAEPVKPASVKPAEAPVKPTVASAVQRQWRHRDPDAYRAYMRDYMARRRHAPSATQGNA